MPNKSAAQALPQQWGQHIEEWRNSGLSQHAVYRENEITRTADGIMRG